MTVNPGEAAARPNMCTVPVKTFDEHAATIVVKHREMLVGQRMQAINVLRGHAAEFEIVAAKGCGNVEALICVLTNEASRTEWLKLCFRLKAHRHDGTEADQANDNHVDYDVPGRSTIRAKESRGNEWRELWRNLGDAA